LETADPEEMRRDLGRLWKENERKNEKVGENERSSTMGVYYWSRLSR